MATHSARRRKKAPELGDDHTIHLGSYATGDLLKARKKECLVRLSGVSKGYRDSLFEDVDLTIEAGDHIGLIGANGCGKTTLLKTLIGEVEADSGEVHAKPDLAYSHVTQVPELEHGRTLLEAVMTGIPKLDRLRSQMASVLESMADPGLTSDETQHLLKEYSVTDNQYRLVGGYDAENRAMMILGGLGLGKERLDQKVETLSGGEKTRAMIARSLVVEPELLLLDEPTNHLDIECMEWLEGFLATVSCAYVIISHDRSFLDSTTERIVELEAGRVTSYPGNYTKYRKLKEAKDATQMKSYELQQREIQREEELIRFLKTLGVKKRRQAKSREKRLAKMERIEKPFKARQVRVFFRPEFPGAEEALKVSNLSKSFPGRILFENLTFALRRGEKLGLIGPNGSGKTTLMRMVAGGLDPDGGEVTPGPFVSLAMYDQELESLNPENTVLEEANESDPHGRLESIRALLAAFLFRGEDVRKKVSKLSGGEKGRLALAKLVVSGANLLLLDEPTNHLDLRSREVLEEALVAYRGSAIVASHDRRLISNVCSRLVVFDGKAARVYNGGYQSYMARRERQIQRGR